MLVPVRSTLPCSAYPSQSSTRHPHASHTASCVRASHNASYTVLLLAQLGEYVAFDRANVQRVATAARKLALNALTAGDQHLMLAQALARATLLAEGGFTWGAVLGGERTEDWEAAANPLAPGLLFAHLTAFLQRTTGCTWQQVQAADDTGRLFNTCTCWRVHDGGM